MKEIVTAVVLAAGYGKRMNSSIAKQYMPINEKPVLYYSLKAFEESSVDEIILVTDSDETESRKNEYIEQYGITKLKKVVTGGKERYHSTYEGLKAVNKADYVLIHDGARPLISKELIEKIIACVKIKKACVTAVPSKDTIKLSDENGYVNKTIDRKSAWMIQTPQAFAYNIIMEAYQKVINYNDCIITDDAMAVELYTKQPVSIVEGSYKNIKITTLEDIYIVEALLSHS